MQPIINYISNPSQLGIAVTKKMANILPDKIYLSLLYRFFIGRKLDLNNPQTFTEKIQWLKLYDRNPLYTQLADKFQVKEYVSRLIGTEYVVPLIGVYDSFEKIDINSLPDKFVLKTNHVGGGSGVVIVSDKKTFEVEKAKSQLEKSLHSGKNKWKEYQYDGIKRAIIAEEYIDHEGELFDYKFFCFNGFVKCFKVDFGRFVDHHANYYDRDCKLLPFGESLLMPNPDYAHKFPDNIDDMIAMAEKLSTGIPFARVDMYNVKNRIYFGEITFHPGSGFVPFSPDIWDYKLGEWLSLPQRNGMQ